MRILLLLALLACAGAAHAGLEPRDAELLKLYKERKLAVPGAIPVGYEHVFEVGDVQEMEVLDRGVTRTLRYHIVGALDGRVVCEVHNGRGLVVAGLIDNNGVFSKAWAGQAGGKPTEVDFKTEANQHDILHRSLRVPWSFALYQLPAASYREGAKYRLGTSELPVAVATFEYGGVSYELTQSHGAENWFGPHWQWSAGGRVLFRVTRREKLAAAQPYLDWSAVLKGSPKAVAPPAWTAPAGGWEVNKQADGSLLVFAYEAEAGVAPDRPDMRTNLTLTPGVFSVPAGVTLQFSQATGEGWAILDYLYEQARVLPVSRVVLSHEAASDRGIVALADYKNLKALELLALEKADLTAKGVRALARLSGLRELVLRLPQDDQPPEFWDPLKGLENVEVLELWSPRLAAFPPGMRGWSKLSRLSIRTAGVDGIGSLSALADLELAAEKVSSQAAAEIVALPALASLTLAGKQLAPSSVGKLKALKALTLRMKGEFAALYIEKAAGMSALETLILEVPDLRGEDVLALASSKVSHLCIRGGLATSEDVTALAKLTALKRLELGYVRGADAPALKALTALTALRSLTLTSPEIADPRKPSVELAALAGFTFLHELHLLDCEMAKVGALGLAKFSDLKALTLGQVNMDAALLADLGACVRLETLALPGTLLPRGAADTLAGLKSLRRLDLRANHSVLKEDLARLRKALPECEIQD